MPGLDRARDAAESLGAEGLPVTSRSVRERAGVRMSVATQAARDWAARGVGEAVPDIPPAVAARFDGLWREAFVAARKGFDAERAGFAARLEEQRSEIEDLDDAVRSYEGELRRVEENAVTIGKQLGEREGEIDELRRELVQERDRARDAEQRAARAEATALTLQATLDKALAAAGGKAPSAKPTRRTDG